MGCNDDRLLRCDLAWVFGAMVAPEEHTVFPIRREAYFGPGGKDREDEEPGFNGVAVMAPLTRRPFTRCRTRNHFSSGGL